MAPNIYFPSFTFNLNYSTNYEIAYFTEVSDKTKVLLGEKYAYYYINGNLVNLDFTGLTDISLFTRSIWPATEDSKSAESSLDSTYAPWPLRNP